MGLDQDLKELRRGAVGPSLGDFLEEFRYLKKTWKVDTVVALRSDMNVLEDARGLLRLGPVKWQDYYPASKELPVVGPLGIAIPQPQKKDLSPEKVVAFNSIIDYRGTVSKQCSHAKK